MVAVHVATVCMMLPYHGARRRSNFGLQNLHIMCSEVHSNASNKSCVSCSSAAIAQCHQRCRHHLWLLDNGTGQGLLVLVHQGN